MSRRLSISISTQLIAFGIRTESPGWTSALEAARNDPLREEPSLPAGRAIEQVDDAGRWSKIRQGGYSAGKARRIIPQIIEKVETRAS